MNSIYVSYAIFYLRVLCYSIGSLVVCGLIVFLCQRLFYKLMGSKAGYKAIIVSSVIGTPVHELGHAIMCLLFGHRIVEIALWKPDTRTGQLGYVNHAYNHRNIYQKLGNLFIGIGPMISGIAVLTAAMYFCFPETAQSYYHTARSLVESGSGEVEILNLGLTMIPKAAEEFCSNAVSPWVRIAGMFVMLSVSLHINLSTADLKAAVSALPIYMLLMLLTSIVVISLGNGAMSKLMNAMQLMHTHFVVMFSVIFVFAVLQILLAMIFYILRKIF